MSIVTEIAEPFANFGPAIHASLQNVAYAAEDRRDRRAGANIAALGAELVEAYETIAALRSELAAERSRRLLAEELAAALA